MIIYTYDMNDIYNDTCTTEIQKFLYVANQGFLGCLAEAQPRTCRIRATSFRSATAQYVLALARTGKNRTTLALLKCKLAKAAKEHQACTQNAQKTKHYTEAIASSQEVPAACADESLGQSTNPMSCQCFPLSPSQVAASHLSRLKAW